MTESDTPSGESGDLSIDDAGSLLADLLDPPKKEETPEPEPDTEIDPPKEDEPEPEAEPEPNEAEEGDDAPITIKVDGKPITLTRAEWAEKYKADLRQADYTRKTMVAAETTKAAEAEIAKAQQERHAYQQNLAKVAAQLEGALEEQGKIDWDALIANDPHEALKQQHLLQKRQAALQQTQAEQRRIEQMAQADEARARATRLATEQQELLAKLPEWKDPAKAKAETEALRAHLVERGYTPDQVTDITDHKAVLLARDAMLYRQMVAKANVAAKKVQNAPAKVERPGTSTDRNPLDGRTAAMRAHAKSGSVESAAAVFASLL